MMQLILVLCRQNPNLVQVKLNQCNSITDNTAKALSSCANLKVLELGRCKGITFFSTHYLSLGCTKLIKLDLSRCNPFANDKAPVIRFPSLRHLEMVACSWIGEIVLMAIAKGCPLIQNLNLERCAKLNDIGISIIARRCSELRTLILGQVSGNPVFITDVSVKILSEFCKKLQILDLTACNISLNCISLFAESFPNLHTLILPSISSVFTQNLKLRKQRPSLTIKFAA